MFRCIALSLLAGCAATATEPGVRAAEYYRLKSGTRWVYEAHFLGKQESRTVVMGPKLEGFWTDDAGGKLMYDGAGLRDERRYLLKEPIQPGASWSSVAALGAVERYEILAAREPCKVKAGQFEDCVRVRSTLAAGEGKLLENVMTFARGVGLVRVATSLINHDRRTTQVEMELTDFR